MCDNTISINLHTVTLMQKCVWIQYCLTCKYDRGKTSEEETSTEEEGGTVEIHQDTADKLANHVGKHLTAHDQT